MSHIAAPLSESPSGTARAAGAPASAAATFSAKMSTAVPDPLS
jgi:hypothetical protein